MSETLVTKQLLEKYDYLAPDGSEIRLLSVGERGSLAHCTLPAGQVSSPVKHRTVEEIWYCLSGEGEVWRSSGDCNDVVPFHAGTSLTIATGTSFQFRNPGTNPLTFVITTMPPWPGSSEAVPVEGYWHPSSANNK